MSDQSLLAGVPSRIRSFIYLNEVQWIRQQLRSHDEQARPSSSHIIAAIQYSSCLAWPAADWVQDRPICPCSDMLLSPAFGNKTCHASAASAGAGCQ